jgi:hypothetical protein
MGEPITHTIANVCKGVFVVFILIVSSGSATLNHDTGASHFPWNEVKLTEMSAQALMESNVLDTTDNVGDCLAFSSSFEVMVKEDCLRHKNALVLDYSSTKTIFREEAGMFPSVRKDGSIWHVRPPLLSVGVIRECIRLHHVDKLTAPTIEHFLAPNITSMQDDSVLNDILFDVLHQKICKFQVPIFHDVEEVLKRLPLWFTKGFVYLDHSHHHALSSKEELESIVFRNFDRLLSHHSINSQDAWLPHSTMTFRQRPIIFMSVPGISKFNRPRQQSPVAIANIPGNPGDHFGAVVFSYLSSHDVVFDMMMNEVRDASNRTALGLVGSILCAQYSSVTHWGPGAISSSCLAPRPPHYGFRYQSTILAVRGPRSRNQVLEYSGVNPAVIMDLALLAPSIFPKHPPALRALSDRYLEVCVIVHGVDREILKSHYDFAYRHLYFPHETNLRSLMWRIQFCRRVVSSSLHGVIFAHAFGIPAAPIALSTKVHGGDWKFRDHFHSVGVHTFKHRIDLTPSLERDMNSTAAWVQLARDFPQPKFPIDTNHFYRHFPALHTSPSDARGYRGTCMVTAKPASGEALDPLVAAVLVGIQQAVTERAVQQSAADADASYSVPSLPLPLPLPQVELIGAGMFCVAPSVKAHYPHNSLRTSSSRSNHHPLAEHKGMALPLLIPASVIQRIDDTVALSRLSDNSHIDVVMSAPSRPPSMYIPHSYAASAVSNLRPTNGELQLKLILGSAEEEQSMCSYSTPAANASALQSYLLDHSYVFINATVGSLSSLSSAARMRNAVIFLMAVLHRCVPVVESYDASYMDGFAFYSIEEFIKDDSNGGGGDVASIQNKKQVVENNRLLLEWKHTFTAVDFNRMEQI